MRLSRMIELLDYEGHGGQAPDLFFLQDSVFVSVAKADEDQRPLERTVPGLFPGLRTSVIALTGANIPLYREFLEIILGNRALPGLLVLPLSIRSFSPQWMCKPFYTYDQLRRELSGYRTEGRYGPDREVDVEEDQPLDEYARLRAEFPILGERGLLDVEKEIKSLKHDPARRSLRPKMAYIFFYLFAFDRGHPHLALWRELFARAAKAGLRILVYIMPVNVERCRKEVGPEFDRVFKANAALLRDFAAEQARNHGVRVTDFLEVMGRECFYDYTEHLNQEGRQRFQALLRPEVLAALT